MTIDSCTPHWIKWLLLVFMRQWVEVNYCSVYKDYVWMTKQLCNWLVHLVNRCTQPYLYTEHANERERTNATTAFGNVRLPSNCNSTSIHNLRKTQRMTFDINKIMCNFYNNCNKIISPVALLQPEWCCKTCSNTWNVEDNSKLFSSRGLNVV